MTTDRFNKFKHMIGNTYMFKGLYIKNGLQTGTIDKALLLTDVVLVDDKDVEVYNHVWIKNNEVANKLSSKQHQEIIFLGKPIQVVKPESLYETKIDLGLEIVELF